MLDNEHQHMTPKEKFFKMYVAHRSWMEQIRRRVARKEIVPQDIDGTVRMDLTKYGILATGKEKGASILIIASDEMLEFFKNPEVVQEAKDQSPPSGPKSKRGIQVDPSDEVTKVITNGRLRDLLRRSSDPPPPRSKRDGKNEASEDVDVSQLT